MKQKTNSKSPMTVQTVHLEDEVSASFLVPKYVLDGRPLAIVDESVLERLKNLLRISDVGNIIKNFTAKAEGIYNLKDWVKLLSEELAFHKTVNMLDTYFDPSVEKVVEKPFNVTSEPTLEELYLQRNALEEQARLLDEKINNHPDRQREVVVSTNNYS